MRLPGMRPRRRRSSASEKRPVSAAVAFVRWRLRHYRTEFGAVLAWTIGTALVSGGLIVGLLRGKLK